LVRLERRHAVGGHGAKAVMQTVENSKDDGTVREEQGTDRALVPAGEGKEFALRTALHLWATATTDAGSHCRKDRLRAKQQAAAEFFSHCGKLPGEVRPDDVEA
jgi:hypothetical protein